MIQENSEKQHQFETNKKYYTISIYTVAVVLICAIIVKLIFSWADTASFAKKYISAATPVIAGFFVAYLLNPLVNFLERKFFGPLLKGVHKKISRTLSIIFSYLIVVGMITVIIVYLVPQLETSITKLVSTFQLWYEQALIWLNSLQERYPEIDFTSVTETLQTSVMNFLDLDRITNMVSGMLPKIFSTSVSVFKAFYNILFAFIVSIYVLFDKNRLVRNLSRFIRAVFPPKKAQSALYFIRTTHHIFSRFIIGKTVDSLIIGILCFISMSILQMPFALIISIIVGITNMVPYVGPFVGAVPGFLIIVMVSPLQSFFYLILILIIQQFDGLYLGPKILGDSTGLRPIWIIFAISVGGAAGGVLGMFLGVPFVAVIALLLDQWVDKKIVIREEALAKQMADTAAGEETSPDA